MGPRRHGSARTTAAVRRAMPQRPERLATRAEREDLTPETVAQWQTRPPVHDAPMGPKPPRSTVLPRAEAARIGAFRTQTGWPLEDGLSAWQATRPHGSRSAQQRGRPRYGIRRVPDLAGEKPAEQPCKASPIGDFPIDLAEVRTAEGKRSRWVAIDRTGPWADATRHAAAHPRVAAQVLRHVMAAVPSTLHRGLPDHGSPFTHRTRDRSTWHQIFNRVCQAYGSDQRLPTTNHPWPNGPGERLHRTLKDATVKTYHEQTHPHLTAHLQAFLMTDNFARRLKTLKGLTPDEDICQCWHNEPARLTINPSPCIFIP